MEGIDPRLRDAAPQQFEQHQRPSSSYSGVTSQVTGYDALPQSNAATSAGPSQPHQYYGMPTPGSYSSGPHQDAGDSPYEVQGPQNSSDPNDLKRPRACEACRQLKVRCEPDDSSPTGSCRRCAKANRQCIVTAPSRKRQKKTDSRVAELEKKIDALTATLHAQRGPGSDNASLDPAIAQAQMTELERQRGQLYEQQSWPEKPRDSPGRRGPNILSSPLATEGQTGLKRKYTGEIQVYNEAHDGCEQPNRRTTIPNPPKFIGLFNGSSSSPKEISDNSYIDVIDRNIVDAPTAYRIFDRFTTEMQILPFLVFRAGTKAEDIRRSKPVLFLAILSAASNTIRPDLQPTFVSEIMRVLADRIICRGEKSFEIVQGLQVVTVFYQPPDRYEELNFNQLIHIAVVMAIDIGMGKRSRASHFSPWREHAAKIMLPDPDTAETRRAWLGLYFMCANASMSLRRPLLVRWSAYMDESLEVLAKAADAVPSDKWLAHIVRSQHIAEEVGYQFSMDDPPSDVSITQPKIQYQMKTFEKQLDEWRRKSTKDMPQGVSSSVSIFCRR
jgi:Fungal Zn(2)-Cys(6) binuclear cluster domain